MEFHSCNLGKKQKTTTANRHINTPPSSKQIIKLVINYEVSRPSKTSITTIPHS